jgi:SAM-dependent methyltransferase
VQYWALSRFLDGFQPEEKKALQFASDPLTPYLRLRFRVLQTADLFEEDVDLKLDLRNIDLPDKSVDFVFASHVLEHVDNDEKALQEIRRILKPGGVAFLPVPVIAERTIEYPHPVETEHNHVRAPGEDYFDRYRAVFSAVEVLASADCPPRIQPFIHEDRTKWPTKEKPYRLPMVGGKHATHVPICYTGVS